ncbi:MAG: hypothetical protein V3T17_15215 [Pseudomonadales bacterium]
MSEYVILDIDQLNPEPVVQKQCQQLLASTVSRRLLLISYPFEEYWLDVEPCKRKSRIQLTGLYALEKRDGQISIRFTVTEKGAELCAVVRQATGEHPPSFSSLCDHFSLPDFHSKDILPLSPINIAKPWGQEIWYTAIEERGVAGVSNGRFKLPLPWVLSALPSSLCADQQRLLILLKILDPLPQEVFGDLYFELHQEKREVYVVTSINKEAWPKGEGCIRFGFDQYKRKQYSSDRAFRADFVLAVKDYEKVRREIDGMIDAFRVRDEFGVNEPVSVDVLRDWLNELPAGLQEDERRLRGQMDSFTNKLPLALGDVVKVPCLTPHSLQHGVRTIEFQTPVYERLILSFAQKVLTQPHWDIDAAAGIMTLGTPEQPLHNRIMDCGGVVVERIVDFKDFEVQRILLASGAHFMIPSPDAYGVLIAVKGSLVIGDMELKPEDAAIIPGECDELPINNHCSAPISFLLAFPLGSAESAISPKMGC